MSFCQTHRSNLPKAYTLLAQRAVSAKHGRYAFYHLFAEAFAAMVCDLFPNKMITSAFVNMAVYFMCNLRRTAAAFFIYYLFMFVVILTMSMVFRMLGSLSRTIAQAMAPASVLVMLFITYTGFAIPAGSMVNWLAWIRWVNPIAYAYESLMINEVITPLYTCDK